MTAPLSGITLQVVPVGAAAPPPWLGGELSRRLGLRVGPGEPMPLCAAWVDARGGQVRSSSVVDALIERAEACLPDPGTEWLLAVVDEDLYVPGMDFVFGEATVGGSCAVIGLLRLRDGVGADPAVFRRRVVVEAVHELGHVAGLPHCPDPGCVMFFSGTLGDTDRKGPDPCPGCARALQRLGAKRGA